MTPLLIALVTISGINLLAFAGIVLRGGVLIGTWQTVLDRIVKQVDTIEKRVELLGDTLARAVGQLNDMERRLARNEQRVDALYERPA